MVERKNRTLVEIARTMLIDSDLPKNFWAEAVSTACYVTNRCLIRSILNKTPYELLNNRKPKLSYLRAFGCKCFILNNGKDDLGKFDPKSDEGVFVGYSLTSKAYRVFNKRTMCVEESIHVIFDECGKINNLADREDDEIEELLQIQRDDISEDTFDKIISDKVSDDEKDDHDEQPDGDTADGPGQADDAATSNQSHHQVQSEEAESDDEATEAGESNRDRKSVV